MLKVEDASKKQLLDEINRFAKVNSMNAKMYLKIEDTSLAKKGSKVTYPEVNATVVAQRPANIYFKAEFLSADIAQMTSDGDKFCLAILKKYKKFLRGTNSADYSKLEKGLKQDSSVEEQNVNALMNLRPQHFTDAILLHQSNSENTYLQSTIYQNEEDDTQKKVTRGYYLLDEFVKDNNGELKIARRFWFDRVVSIRLARQQLFDAKGEIESDIIYGKEGDLTKTGDYKNLPLRIEITRPKEKLILTLTYQSPESVTIGKVYPAKAFILENSWGLEEVNLDEQLRKATGQSSAISNQ